MHILDWTILVVFLTGLIGVGIYCRKYVKGVADFLVAGRGVGKYLGTTASDASGYGLISLVAIMQATYVAGPSFFWFNIQGLWIGLFIGITGWGIYRLRETRIMTVNELLERRYSRKFRLFCGILCFTSGIINLGIFPIIEARFFVYFLSLPITINLFGIAIPTVTVVSAILITVSLIFCFIGGQISVIATDFIQGLVIVSMYIVISIIVYRIVNWDDLHTAIMSQPKPATMVNPFDTDKGANFGLWFMIIAVFQPFYNILSWSPGAIRGQSAKDAKEARLMYLLSRVKTGMLASIFFISAAAFAFLHLPKFADQASSINTIIDSIANEKIRTQLAVPLFLREVLPMGVMGLFTASLLALCISTYDTYFLSWAGVLVQDVICTVKKKELSSKSHVLLLRLSTTGIALFVWIFSVMYQEVDYIYMFMWITGSIYMAGAGIAIMGALYWRRATTAGAWAAIITGMGLTVCGIVLQQLWNFIPVLRQWREEFPLNGVHIFFYSSTCAIISYFVVSLLTPNNHFDLDAMLNRKSSDNTKPTTAG